MSVLNGDGGRSQGETSGQPSDSLPQTPAPSQALLPTTPAQFLAQHHHTSGHQDGINPETAALLAAAAAHGRQDAVQLPRDAKLVSLMLQGMGVEDYEPRVVPQLLEFMHRYVLDVLGDAQTYAEHANHNNITTDDVRIAIEGRAAHSFTNPPRREFLEALAAKKNAAPLPLIPEKYGVRLPPERHTLTGTNFQIAVKKAAPKPLPAFPSTNGPQQMGGVSNDSAATSLPALPHISSTDASGIIQPPTFNAAPPPALPSMPVSQRPAANDDYDDDDEDDLMEQ
ncbi:Transcription initiation factor TFIID subunit 9B [Thoreauomyces humboldtii]|nr:Transcription initiation factor TFIID subunit 9B [Thoreauomyces humboldtii]